MHPTVCVQVLAVTVVIYCGRCLSFIMRERESKRARKKNMLRGKHNAPPKKM